MCGNAVHDADVHTCGQHRAQEAAVAAAVVVAQAAPVLPDGVPACPVRLRSGLRRGQVCGKRCNATINGARMEHVCSLHIHTRIREIQLEQDPIDDAAIRAVAILNGVEEHIRLIRWSLDAVPFRIYPADPEQAGNAAAQRALAAYAHWNARRNWRMRVAPAPAPPAGLGRFAQDAQNVHTREANVMVENAKKELEGAVAIENSLTQIKARFKERKFGTETQRRNVHADMTIWYSDARVMRAVGQLEDNTGAYKRLLDKVWGMIQTSKHKDDLEQRLWEEAVDSLGMCTQGHMTRLANVLQGFEEAAEAPKVEIPKGERLQAAMAQINELPANERESAARRVFAELEIADGEEGAWLEALEVA